MTPQEYFGDWWKCIDSGVLFETMSKVKATYGLQTVYPHLKDIFKAFELCPYNELKVVIIGQDPYPDGSGTGIAFANKSDTDTLSISLAMLLSNFNTIKVNPNLEHWAKQGVLLLNSSLTVVKNNPGSHTMLWRPFMTSFIKNLCEWNTGLIFVLLGEQAKTFKPYIGKFNNVLEFKHPAYYARTDGKMPNIFAEIDKLTKAKNNLTINWYGK